MTGTTIVTTDKGTYEPVDNNPHAVAETLTLVKGCLWLPAVKHWEIATTGDLWGLHGEIDADAYGPATRTLQKVADYFGVTVDENEHRNIHTDFIYAGTPIRFWWLNPVIGWSIPETCATCPTRLDNTGTTWVRIGDGTREAPVICLPCRDRMQTAFLADNGATA